MLARALSIRVMFFSLVVGVCAGVLVGLVWGPATMPVTWLVAAGCYVMAVMNHEQAIRCAGCGKRVKLGYTRCHHCGQGQVPTS
jgi:uncharacterized membrane protein YoaK (UPF0700 family)